LTISIHTLDPHQVELQSLFSFYSKYEKILQNGTIIFLLQHSN
jgi:hypothetical protein